MTFSAEFRCYIGSQTLASRPIALPGLLPPWPTALGHNAATHSVRPLTPWGTALCLSHTKDPLLTSPTVVDHVIMSHMPWVTATDVYFCKNYGGPYIFAKSWFYPFLLPAPLPCLAAGYSLGSQQVRRQAGTKCGSGEAPCTHTEGGRCVAACQRPALRPGRLAAADGRPEAWRAAALPFPGHPGSGSLFRGSTAQLRVLSDLDAESSNWNTQGWGEQFVSEIEAEVLKLVNV
jgi:hypothetical protein